MSKSKSVRVVEGIHVPTKKTREQVCKMVACGLSAEEISFVLGCAPHEVKAHYEQEMIHGTAMITAAVGGAMLKNALKGDTNAQRAWLQMRSRWTVPHHVELTGKDGGPIEIENRRKLMARVLELAKGVAQPASNSDSADISAGSPAA